MLDSIVKKEILQKLRLLPIEEQRRVLDFARILSETGIVGTPGHQLLKFVGTIERVDLETIKQAIENGCERIDLNEW